MNPERLLSIVVLAGLAALASIAVHAADPTVTQRFYDVHGAKLYTETFGHGAPLLFLHGGLMFFDNAFAKQRDFFAADHSVIGIDQRSHGHSPDGPWALSYQEMSDDTAAVIEKLGVGPVDVVGHSDGANIALLLARDHPQLVRRLVVSGANLRPALPPEELKKRRSFTKQQKAEKVSALASQLPPWFKPDYARVSPDGAEHWLTLLAKCYDMWLQPVVIEPADLKKIAAPVLVMAGDHDFTSIEETTEIFRALPHGQLIIVPATGHGTFTSSPNLVNTAIREFLARPDEAAATPPH